MDATESENTGVKEKSATPMSDSVPSERAVA
jgi:hypothetical protein